MALLPNGLLMIHTMLWAFMVTTIILLVLGFGNYKYENWVPISHPRARPVLPAVDDSPHELRLPDNMQKICQIYTYLLRQDQLFNQSIHTIPAREKGTSKEQHETIRSEHFVVKHVYRMFQAEIGGFRPEYLAQYLLSCEHLNLLMETDLSAFPWIKAEALRYHMRSELVKLAETWQVGFDAGVREPIPPRPSAAVITLRWNALFVFCQLFPEAKLTVLQFFTDLKNCAIGIVVAIILCGVNLLMSIVSAYSCGSITMDSKKLTTFQSARQHRGISIDAVRVLLSIFTLLPAFIFAMIYGFRFIVLSWMIASFLIVVCGFLWLMDLNYIAGTMEYELEAFSMGDDEPAGGDKKGAGGTAGAGPESPDTGAESPAAGGAESPVEAGAGADSPAGAGGETPPNEGGENPAAPKEG